MTTNSFTPIALSFENLGQLSDEEFWQYAHHMAQATSPKPRAVEYLECLLGSEGANRQCLLPLTTLDEVVSPPYRFALLPDIPAWMMGIWAWQGDAIAVIDLAAYLACAINSKAPVQAPTDIPPAEGMVLVVHAKGQPIPLGLFVSAVDLTMAIEDTEVVLFVAENEDEVPKVVYGKYGDALLINVAVLLTDVLKQIEMAASHG